MKRIRTYIYAALLGITALNFAPSLAAAEAPAHGKFTLGHDVHWGSALVSAGEYEFSFDPNQTSRVLTLSKLDGNHARLMLLIVNSDDSKPSDSNQLVLETKADGSYVSAMQLADCGMTLHFIVPSHPLKQMAKIVPTVASDGQ